MPEHTTYPSGTPSWIDIVSPDFEALKAFYGGLFGWDWEPAGTVEETGGYGMFKLRGKSVAGGMPEMQPGTPVAWTTYISVDDAEATAAKVSAAGGQVIVPPMPVMETGTMSVFADPTGAVFGTWQPKEFIGAELVNEPGALTWNELTTRDVEAAEKFYGDVFGWTCHQMESPNGPAYFEWKLLDTTIGGMLQIDENFPPDMPNYWSPYIAVDDAGAAIAKWKELGGKVFMGPTTIPAGTFATGTDSQGAMLNVIQLSEEAMAD